MTAAGQGDITDTSWPGNMKNWTAVTVPELLVQATDRQRRAGLQLPLLSALPPEPPPTSVGWFVGGLTSQQHALCIQGSDRFRQLYTC